MRNYDGQEMEIRTTNKSKFQVLPVPHTAGDMTRAKVFDTPEEAEAYINRPMPQWVADERARAVAKEPYVEAYSAVLAMPGMLEMRRDIQEKYGYACERSRLAAAAQRAAIRGMGQVSCMGRDIGAVRQGLADEYGDELDSAWQDWAHASGAYEVAVQAAMQEAGIPVEMFRSPVKVQAQAVPMNVRVVEGDPERLREIAGRVGATAPRGVPTDTGSVGAMLRGIASGELMVVPAAVKVGATGHCGICGELHAECVCK